MSEEADRRIEAARQQAQRQKDTQEFLSSIKDPDALLRNIQNPEAYVMREKFRGAATRGELKRTGCTHPLERIMQYVDDDPGVARSKPVNLFECGVCHLPLWFADPWGEPVPDN